MNLMRDARTVVRLRNSRWPPRELAQAARPRARIPSMSKMMLMLLLLLLPCFDNNKTCERTAIALKLCSPPTASQKINTHASFGTLLHTTHANDDNDDASHFLIFARALLYVGFFVCVCVGIKVILLGLDPGQDE